MIILWLPSCLIRHVDENVLESGMTKTKQKQEPGLFDYHNRMTKLSEVSSPLEKLDSRIDWEMFRPLLEEVLQQERGIGGRPPYDRVMMFKILVLQRYYNLSEEQTEFQINDRLTFQKFVGLTLSDDVPDKNTIWDFKEKLGASGGIEKLFKRFERHLRDAGLVGQEGKIVDASFVDVPRQRNSREENEAIKKGAVPLDFGKNKNKLSQKDTDARWTKKGNEVHYGYKDHVKADRKSKLIEDYVVTDASVHDSQVTDDLTERGDVELHADSAYKGDDIEKKLKEKEIKSQIHDRAYRNHPLSEEQKRTNREKSKIRVRVEHIFGFVTNSMRDGFKMRSIGLKRISAGIGLINLVYNFARYEQIMRLSIT